MKCKNLKSILVISLMVIEVCLIHLSYKSFTNKPIELDEVKLLNQGNTKANNKSFAIMLNDGDGIYTESSDSSFPTLTQGYIYNEEKSGCINSNGEQIFGVGYII